MSSRNNNSFNQKMHKKIGYVLHIERIRQQQTLEFVAKNTDIPTHVIDSIELGGTSFSLKKALKLADYYGKVVRFYLKDRE